MKSKTLWLLLFMTMPFTRLDAQTVFRANVVVETAELSNVMTARPERLKEYVEQLVQGFSPAVPYMALRQPIDIDITIRLYEAMGVNYTGDILINGYRPLYDSVERSLFYRMVDHNLQFTFDPLVQRAGSLAALPQELLGKWIYYNLYATLAFYYDSFGDDGGETFWQFIRTYANELDTQRRSISDEGASYLSPSAVTPILGEPETTLFREAWSIYHRGVLDNFAHDNRAAYDTLIEVVQALSGLRRAMPDHPFLKLFLDIKSQEISGLIQKADLSLKAHLVQRLNELLPSIR